MTVNIDALIRSLGKTYQEIFDEGLIPYKTKPTGFSGDSDISLDMANEGVYLSFSRSDRVLNEITLNIQSDTKKNWVFPNDLPSPLKAIMERDWVISKLGKPNKTVMPQVIGKRLFGMKDQFIFNQYHEPISMRVSYDKQSIVKSITYIPMAKERW